MLLADPLELVHYLLNVLCNIFLQFFVELRENYVRVKALIPLHNPGMCRRGKTWGLAGASLTGGLRLTNGNAGIWTKIAKNSTDFPIKGGASAGPSTVTCHRQEK